MPLVRVTALVPTGLGDDDLRLRLVLDIQTVLSAELAPTLTKTEPSLLSPATAMDRLPTIADRFA